MPQDFLPHILILKRRCLYYDDLEQREKLSVFHGCCYLQMFLISLVTDTLDSFLRTFVRVSSAYFGPKLEVRQ